MLRLTLILFLFSQTICAQKSTSFKNDPVKEQLRNNEFVTLHIHSNKSTYVSDEKIWFSIYLFNKENAKINLNDHNVVAQLLDKKGTIISKSLLFLSNGQVNGNFNINLDAHTGTYYLRAFILNGAKPDAIFTKPIKIINSTSYLTSEDIVMDQRKNDIQILPEGGYLISDVMNSCGIKVLDSNGKGIQLKNLILEDDTGRILNDNIGTNDLGMGKFSFTPRDNKTYFLSSKLEKFKQKLPKIRKIGIGLRLVQNFKTGELQIELNTNEKSLPMYSDEDITITIHKGRLAYNYTTKFEKEYSKLVFNIPNHKLFPGTNTITVFNKDFQPLAERLFFNFESLKENRSSISKALKENNKNTETYSIINEVNNEAVKTRTSVSVLPLKTSANTNRDHLFASIYLKPFINGNIENPSYYFQNNSNQKRFELDLLLLNQGWRKYKSSINLNTEKTPVLKNSSGLTISGYVVPFKKKHNLKNLLLYSKASEDIEMVNLSENYTFEIENLVLPINSEFNFSVFDSLGKPVKAGFFFTVKPLANVLDMKFEINLTNPFSKTVLTETFSKNVQGEVLDTVEIKANKLKFDKFTQGRFGVKIDSSLYVYNTIEEYFRIKEGLRLVYHDGGGSDTPGYYWTYGNGSKSFFILNGNRASYMNGLLGISMENILELYHGGHDGYGQRMSHIIFTNGKERELPDHLKTSKVFKLKNGFTFQKETYTPKYINFESDSYQKFAAIAWEPLVSSSEKGYSSISFLNPGKHDLLFYIEGYTESGDPFTTITPYKNAGID